MKQFRKSFLKSLNTLSKPHRSVGYLEYTTCFISRAMRYTWEVGTKKNKKNIKNKNIRYVSQKAYNISTVCIKGDIDVL